MTLHIAVAVVSFRNPQDIVLCLSALSKSTYADFEVVICENGGSDAFDQLMTVVPDALPGGQKVRAVLSSSNLGYAGGVNRCLAEAPGADAWWVLNPDTEPHPTAMAELAARLAVGDCDAVGCTVNLPDGTVQSYGGRWRPWMAHPVSLGHGAPQGETVDAAEIERRQSYLNGACMLIGRRFLETVGPMHEEYFLYCEEVDWCLRAIQAGLKLGFAPKAVVLHHQGTSTGNTQDIRSKTRAPVYLNERNKMVMSRDLFPGRFPISATMAFLIIFMRFARRRAWKQLGYALDGWAAGLRGERGAPAWF
jgi:GT2 family glycosyltransferase